MVDLISSSIDLRMQENEKDHAMVVHTSKLNIYCDFIQKRYGMVKKK